MSLRLRLFLTLSAIVALLMGAHGLLVRSLAGKLTAELDSVALVVGSQIASLFVDPRAGDPAAGVDGGGSVASGDESSRTRRVFRYVHVEHDALDPKTAASESEGGASWQPSAEMLTEDLMGPVPPGDSTGSTTGYSYRLERGEGKHERLEIRLTDGKGARFLKVVGPDLKAQVPIPKLGLLERLEDFRTGVWTSSLLLLAVGLLAVAWLSDRVARPLTQLRHAAIAVGEGELGQQVDVNGADREARETIQAFNRMSTRLAALDTQNRLYAQERHLGEIGDIARGLAHNLRNPLNALGLSVEELASRGGDDDHRLLAEQARRQIRRLDRGIRSFLVLASQADGAPEAVDLGELVRDVALEAIQDQAGQIRLELDVAPGLAPIQAVEAELRAIVQALVVNAVEASPSPGQVQVSLAAAGADRWRLAVADQGGGLPALVRQRLFTPHVTTKSNGSGMGLFLAHRLVTGRYRGELRLDDREGGGTVARLQLADRRTDAAP